MPKIWSSQSEPRVRITKCEQVITCERTDNYMSNIIIMTDTASDIDLETAKKYGIHQGHM